MPHELTGSSPRSSATAADRSTADASTESPAPPTITAAVESVSPSMCRNTLRMFTSPENFHSSAGDRAVHQHARGGDHHHQLRLHRHRRSKAMHRRNRNPHRQHHQRQRVHKRRKHARALVAEGLADPSRAASAATPRRSSAPAPGSPTRCARPPKSAPASARAGRRRASPAMYRNVSPSEIFRIRCIPPRDSAPPRFLVPASPHSRPPPPASSPGTVPRALSSPPKPGSGKSCSGERSPHSTTSLSRTSRGKLLNHQPTIFILE